MKINRLCSWIKEKKFLLLQIASFVAGKIILGVIQLPQYEKQENYTIQLAFGTIFYTSSFLLKICSLPKIRFWEIMRINLSAFLLWIIAILMIIFSFSLSRALSWSYLQAGLLTIMILIQTGVLIMLCNWRLISKFQFVIYEIILSINIIALGIKTVVFIGFEASSPNKDIILLNLTTQIAFAILIMDSIERSYKKFLQKSRSKLTTQVQQELTISN